MTREQAREAAVDTADIDYQIGVMQDFKSGKQIEFRFRDMSEDAWQAVVDPKWNWDLVEYRIKPTATLRPWTADEVPVFSLMRKKAYPNHEWLLIAVGNDDIRSDFLNGYEHSTDGGKTWLPCGVEEESK